MTKDLHRIPKKSIESQRMKTAFEKNTGASEVTNEMQAKLTHCVQQLRKGLTDLMKRREDYKAAKLERKKESKEAWKLRKEEHKARIKQCKVRIAQARLEFEQLIQSLKLNDKTTAVAA